MVRNVEQAGRPSPEELRVGQRAVEIYRGWARVDPILDPDNQMGVIDFDLLRQDFRRVNVASREDAHRRLTSLRRNIVPATPYLEYLDAELLSSITYIEALAGKQFEFRDYVEKTLGIVVDPPTSDEIRKQKEKTDESFSRVLGGRVPTRDNYLRYFYSDENRLSRSQIEDQFAEAKSRLVPIIEGKLGRALTIPPDYSEEFVEVGGDAFWISKIAGSRQGIKFELNVHPQVRWVPGRPGEQAFHEHAGHLLKALSWRDNAESGRINPAYIVTPTLGPAQVGDEGASICLPDLIRELKDAMKPEEIFVYDALNLGRLAMYKGHVEANEGRPIEEVKNEALDVLWHETPGRLDRQIRSRTTNNYTRAYMLTYGHGVKFYTEKAQDLGPEGSAELVNAEYEHPRTHKQTRSLVERIMAAA